MDIVQVGVLGGPQPSVWKADVERRSHRAVAAHPLITSHRALLSPPEHYLLVVYCMNGSLLEAPFSVQD